MFHSLESWLTLLSGVVILLMGVRVYTFDPRNRVGLGFFLSTFLLFVQNLFFFEMAHVDSLEVVNRLRPWQETTWNLAAMTIFVTMWLYARFYALRPAYGWEKVLFWAILLASIPFTLLEAFTSYGHGELVRMENGRWGVLIEDFAWYDYLRGLWALSSYLAGIYFAYLPFHYAIDPLFKRFRLMLVIVFFVVLMGSFVQNYVFAYFFGWPSPLNEAASIFVATLLCGLMFSNFRLLEVRSEYAIPNMLRTMTNWYILTDQQFRVRQLNEALANVLSPDTNLNELSITDLLPASQWEPHRARIEGLQPQQTATCEFEFVLHDRPTYILFTVSPIFVRLFRKRGYVFIGTDLTTFKESEKRIRAYADELETTNQTLKRFAYIASHDLKEPLRNIGNFAGLLKKRLGSDLDTDQATFLEFITENVRAMNQLIESILAVALIGEDGIELSPVNGEQLLKQVAAKLNSLLTQKRGSLRFSDLPVLYGDPQLLLQLFTNLVENGIKYNEAEQPLVHIRCRPAANDDGYWEFAISDNGIGIAPDYHEQVFEMFKRLHSRAAYPGTGIGLAICRRIVELHRGEIWIDSAGDEQGGTTFRLTLPARAGKGHAIPRRAVLLG